MKIKKWYFILGAIVALVVLIIILCFTAFSLKSISIDYRTSSENISNLISNEDIINGGKFKKGKPIFFQNKKQYIKNIEDTCPFIKVINIETVFPSKLVVHIAERQKVFAIKGKVSEEDEEKECFYICDNELRVLEIKADFLSTQENSILIETQENGLLKEYKEGEYISEIRKPMLYDALYENNRYLGEQQSIIEKLTLTEEYDQQLKKEIPVSEVKLFSGQTFKIYADNRSMKYKAKLMLDLFSQLFEFDGKEYKIGERIENKIKYGIYVKLNSQYLSSCTIIIANYYNYLNEFENGVYYDCYFKFDITEYNAEEKGLELLPPRVIEPEENNNL